MGTGNESLAVPMNLILSLTLRCGEMNYGILHFPFFVVVEQVIVLLSILN